MKRLTILITLLTALAITASASARPLKHSCAPASRAFTYRLQETGSTCSTARAIERYLMSHEVEQPFRLAGRQWWPNLYSRRQGHTWYWFATPNGRSIVYVTTRYPVS